MKRKVVWLFGTVVVPMLMSSMGYSDTMTQAMIDWDLECTDGVVADANNAEYVQQPAYLQSEQTENTYWPSLNSAVTDAKNQYTLFLSAISSSLASYYGQDWRNVDVGNGSTLGDYYAIAQAKYWDYGAEMCNFNSYTTSMVSERGDLAYVVISTTGLLRGEVLKFQIAPVGVPVMLGSVGVTLLGGSIAYIYNWSQYNSWRTLRSQSLNLLNDQFMDAVFAGEDLGSVSGGAWTTTVDDRWASFLDSNSYVLYATDQMENTDNTCFDKIDAVDDMNWYWEAEQWWVQE